MYRLAIIVLCLIFVGLQYRLWIGNGSYAEVHGLHSQIQHLQDKNSKLKEKNKAIEVQVSHLKKGKAAVEERARNELGMIRDGEQFYLYSSKPADTQDQQAGSAASK